MPRPVQIYDFTAFSRRTPTAQPPGDRLDAQFREHADAIAEIQQALSALRAELARLSAAPREPTLPTPALYIGAGGPYAGDDKGATATSADYAQVSIDWAEHMPDIIPGNTLAINAISGDHWSSRWWAHQAAATVAQFRSTATTVSLSLYYIASAGQTVFPLSVPDRNGKSFAFNRGMPEGLAAHISGLRKEGGFDFTVDVADSAVTFLAPLTAGQHVIFDLLTPADQFTSSISLYYVSTNQQNIFDLNVADSVGNVGTLTGTDVPAYRNGLRLTAVTDYIVDVANNQIVLTSPVAAGQTLAFDILPTISNLPGHPLVVDLVKTFGAVADGTTPADPAWYAFANWAVQQTQAIALILQPGTYLVNDVSHVLLGANGAPHSTAFGYSIPEYVTVYGYAATVTQGWLGGFAAETAPYRLHQVNAGDTTVTFVNPADAAHFLLDGNPPPYQKPIKWIMLAGLELQIASGPVNDHFFEYAQIASVNTVAGTLTLKTPAKYTYKTTWPNWNVYSTWYDGPASIYIMEPRFDCNVVWRGVTFSYNTQMYADGVSIKFVDCKFPNGAIIPSQNLYWEADNCTLCSPTGQVEFDKLVAEAVLNNCTGWSVVMQSSSNDKVTFNGGSYNYITLGAKQNVLNGVTVLTQLAIGPLGYGMGVSLQMNNCYIAAISHSTTNTTIANMTCVNGVFSWPNTGGYAASGPIEWAIPNARCFFMEGGDGQRIYGGFTVTDVTQDGTYTYAHTDRTDWATMPSWTGAYPPVTHLGGVAGGIKIVGSSGNSGSLAAVDMSYPGAQGLLAFSYTKRTYSGNLSAALPVNSNLPVWGLIQSITVNVTQPYTGAQSSCIWDLEQFGVPVWNPSRVTSTLPIQINLKIAGTRVITQSGVTGAQSGDVIPSIAGMHLMQGALPYLSVDISGDTPAQQPIVTLEIITDQTQH